MHHKPFVNRALPGPAGKVPISNPDSLTGLERATEGRGGREREYTHMRGRRNRGEVNRRGSRGKYLGNALSNRGAKGAEWRAPKAPSGVRYGEG